MTLSSGQKTPKSYQSPHLGKCMWPAAHLSRHLLIQIATVIQNSSSNKHCVMLFVITMWISEEELAMNGVISALPILLPNGDFYWRYAI